MAPGCRTSLSMEHQRQLLELANSQHAAWQRLLQQLCEDKETHISEMPRIPEVRNDEFDKAFDPKLTPGRMLSNTTTVQPEPPTADAVSTFSAEYAEVQAVKRKTGSPNSDLHDTDLPMTLEVEREASRAKASWATQEEVPKKGSLQWVKPKLNYIAGILVVSNTLLMFLELELEGQAIAKDLALGSSSWDPNSFRLFRVFDGFFDIAFLLEMVLRIWCDGSGWRFLLRTANQLELMLVIVGMVDFFIILMVFHGSSRDDSVTLHLFRSAHALRALRSCRLFKGLRVLLRACEAFISSLLWAMVLLLIFMSAGSILIGNLLQSFIMSDADLDERKWIWEHYGTAYRCGYTLYELTFAGNWPTRARPVTDMVDPRFALFFFAYITVVSFAMIRVVTAVFLKDTLEAAQNDQELQLLNQLQKKAEYVKKLEHIFKTIDDGNGIIKEDRLLAVMADPQVMAHLQTLELDVHEGTALFHLLDNGDGEVTLEEFIDGILRCKGPARAVDQVAMRAEIRQIDAKVMKVLRHLPNYMVGNQSVGLDPKPTFIDVSTHLKAFSNVRHLGENSSRRGSKLTQGTASGSLKTR